MLEIDDPSPVRETEAVLKCDLSNATRSIITVGYMPCVTVHTSASGQTRRMVGTYHERNETCSDEIVKCRHLLLSRIKTFELPEHLIRNDDGLIRSKDQGQCPYSVI